MYRDQPVKLVKHKFEHRQVYVEEVRDGVSLNYFSHHSPSKGFFLLKRKVEESCNKVHTLAIVQIWIDDCICFQDPFKSFLGNVFQTIKRPQHIHFNIFRKLFRKLKLLLLVIQLKLSFGKFLINPQYGKPHTFSLPLNIVDIRSHQALLKNLISQYLIEIFAKAQQISEACICIDISDHNSQNLGCVIEPKLLESVAPLEQ